METQWPRQKAQWLSQRGRLGPCTALTRPLIQILIFSGMSSISTKLLNSSWRARRQTRGQSIKVFRPLLLRVTAPSTCRNPQCKHQTRLCTTVLWVTRWEGLQGELNTNPRGAGGLKWAALGGRGTFSPWAVFSLFRAFQENKSSSDLIPRNPGGWDLFYRENRVDVSLKEDPSSDPQKCPCSARKTPPFSRLTFKKIYFLLM